MDHCVSDRTVRYLFGCVFEMLGVSVAVWTVRRSFLSAFVVVECEEAVDKLTMKMFNGRCKGRRLIPSTWCWRFGKMAWAAMTAFLYVDSARVCRELR